ncbi:MAG: SMC-Scp complex subunit ScpB, partial [Methyloversatilis sp.]|nr:SMC-Scp complex subunit ScpB [Methyloversatilis sp.]
MSETPELPSQNLSDVKRILEAALLSSQDALSTGDMRRLFVDELDPTLIRRVLDDLREDWTGRGIELVQ